MFDLQLPRHTSTLPTAAVRSRRRRARFAYDTGRAVALMALQLRANCGHSNISRTRTLDGVEPFRRLIEIDFLDQEVDEGAHPRRQPTAVAHIDDVDLLDIARVEGLQHRD